MSERVATLAARFDRAAEAFIGLIERCDDEQWRSTVADEGWPVGFVAKHVAWGMLGESRLIALAARGEPMPELTMADIDASNRRNFEKHVDPDRERVLAQLRKEAGRAAGIVRDLDDEALDIVVDLPAFRSEPMTIEALVNDLLIWHVESHMAGVRAIVEG